MEDTGQQQETALCDSRVLLKCNAYADDTCLSLNRTVDSMQHEEQSDNSTDLKPQPSDMDTSAIFESEISIHNVVGDMDHDIAVNQFEEAVRDNEIEGADNTDKVTITDHIKGDDTQRETNDSGECKGDIEGRESPLVTTENVEDDGYNDETDESINEPIKNILEDTTLDTDATEDEYDILENVKDTVEDDKNTMEDDKDNEMNDNKNTAEEEKDAKEDDKERLEEKNMNGEVSESTQSTEVTDSASETCDETLEDLPADDTQKIVSTQTPKTCVAETQSDIEMECTDENGIEIDESDILKSVDEFGRGKRSRVEKTDKLYVHTDESTPTKSPSSAHKRGKAVRYCRSSINHDLLMEAYKIGWRRELVIRNVYEEYTAAGNPKKTPADVYYRSPPPNSKKLRSLKEVQKFLNETKSPLNIDNFSFLRESVSEPPYEFVRHAGKGRGCQAGVTKLPEVVIERDGDDEETNVSINTTVEESPSQKNTASSTSTPRPLKLSPSRGRGRPRKYAGIKIGRGRPPAKFASKQHTKLVYVHTASKRKVETLIMDDLMLPPNLSEMEDKKDDTIITQPSKKHKSVARKSTTPRQFKPSNSSPPEYTGTEALCTLNCPGQENIPPTLHCSVCLCLFHPQCVAFPPNTDRTFVCLRCVDVSSSDVMKTTSDIMTVAAPVLLKESEAESSVTNSNMFPVAPSNIKQEPIDTYEQIPITSSTVGTSSTKISSHREANPVLLGHLRNNILEKAHLKGIAGSNTPPHMPMMVHSPGITKVCTTSSASSTTYSVINSHAVVSVDGLRVLNSSVTNTPQRNLLVPGTNANTVPVLTSTPLMPNPRINLTPPCRTLFVPTTTGSPLFGGNIPLTVSRLLPPALIGTKTHPVPSVGITPTSPPPMTLMPPRLTAAPKLPANSSPPTLTDHHSPISNGFMSPVRKELDTKTGQILTLPSAVSKRLNLQQPLALKINNMQIKVPPSSFLHTTDGLKVFLPPKTFPVQFGETAKLSVTVTNDKTPTTSVSVNFGVSTNNVGEQNACTAGNSSPSKDSSGSESSYKLRTRRWKPGINPSNCFIKRLYGGFDCMFNIFQYLNIKDLLRVSVVCKTWRQIAMHPILWQEVKFRNMKVPNWETAVEFLTTRTVQSVNLKGLLHGDNRNRTWHQLVTSLHRLSNLKSLHFGLVPASVLHAMCEKMPQLEILTAEWISDFTNNQMWTVPTKVDVGMFSSLKNMKELRLRGVSGLTLPSFSFSGGISQIAKLEKLTTLSLTTLKDVADNEFSFLSELTHLKTLELGDCSLWSSETYFQLGRLTNLTSLHLECGGEIPDIGLGDALMNMKQLVHLELIMFAIAEGLHHSLNQLENLRSLVVWPDTTSYQAALVNSCTLEVVKGLFMLDRLEWGILNSKNTSTDLDSNENSQTPMANSTEWIPLLPSDVPLDGSELPFDTHPQYIGVRQFTKKLLDYLPNTQIKVFSTSMLSARNSLEEEDS